MRTRYPGILFQGTKATAALPSSSPPLMTRRSMLSLTTGAAALMFFVSSEWSVAQTYLTLPDGGKVDLAANCPVCGMKVGGDMNGSATYSYRDNRLVGFAGMAAAVFRDGTVVGFEGARCLFIYNTIPKRFGIDVGNIVHRYVIDFPTKKMIDAKDAFLVLGSTIIGPMGRELVAFTSKTDAEEFMSEYQGKRLVQLNTIVPAEVERSGGFQK